VSGPLPTHFRWLWYLVGLAGMSLAIVGLLAMIGSIVNDGLILPALGVVGVGLGYVLVRYRRRPRSATADEAMTGGLAPPIDADVASADPVAAPAKARRSDPGRTSRR
jgi:hypothetical protein